MVGFFDRVNLNETEIHGKGKYFQEGNYLVEISETKEREKKQGSVFVIEAKVLAARSDADDAPAAGEYAAQVFTTYGNAYSADLAQKNWMEFVCGVLGCEPKDQTSEEWSNLTTQALKDQLFSGTVMRLQCWEKETKSGGTFTVHKWIRQATEKDYAEFGLEFPGGEE